MARLGGHRMISRGEGWADWDMLGLGKEESLDQAPVGRARQNGVELD